MLEYVAIAVIIVLATLIALIAIGLGGLFGPRKNTVAKNIPYESGIKPYGEGTRRMPVRFYLIAVLFILFDIEVIFFLPWAIVFRQLGLFARFTRFTRYRLNPVILSKNLRSSRRRVGSHQ